jgi:hypothetical protein
MNAQDEAWQAGQDAIEALAPESGLPARLDPAALGASVGAHGRPTRRRSNWAGKAASTIRWSARRRGSMSVDSGQPSR